MNNLWVEPEAAQLEGPDPGVLAWPLLLWADVQGAVGSLSVRVGWAPLPTVPMLALGPGGVCRRA